MPTAVIDPNDIAARQGSLVPAINLNAEASRVGVISQAMDKALIHGICVDTASRLVMVFATESLRRMSSCRLSGRPSYK